MTHKPQIAMIRTHNRTYTNRLSQLYGNSWKIMSKHKDRQKLGTKTI